MPSKPRYTGGVPTVDQIDEAVLAVMSRPEEDGRPHDVLADRAAGTLASWASPNAVLIEVPRVAERVDRVRRLSDYLAIKAQAVMFRAGARAITAYDLIPELRTSAIEWLADEDDEPPVDFDQIDEDVLIGLLRRGSGGQIAYDRDGPHGGAYKLVGHPAQETEPSAALAKLRHLMERGERARQRVSPRPGGASTAQQIDAKLLEVLGRRRDVDGPAWRGVATVVDEVLDELGVNGRASVRARIAVLVDSGSAIRHDSRDAIRLTSPEYPGGEPTPEVLDDAILSVLVSSKFPGLVWLGMEELYRGVVARLALRMVDGYGDVLLSREALGIRLDELGRSGKVELDSAGQVRLVVTVSSVSPALERLRLHLPPTPDRPQGTRRLNINVHPMTARQIDELAESLGGATQTEVIRRAVALLHQVGTEFVAGQSAGSQ